MTDPETTFTVEVLGFASEADPETLAGSVSEFFGISLEEGRRLVKKRPIRVKRRAPAAVAQQLVKQLRRLGADVLVRNEASGEERAYHAKSSRGASASRDPEGPSGEPLSSRESIPGSQPFAPIKPELGPASRQSGPGVLDLGPASRQSDPMEADLPMEGDPQEETLESADGEAPPEPPPSVEVVSARDVPSPASAPTSAPSSASAPTSSDRAARARLPSAPGPINAEPGEPRAAPVSQKGPPRAPNASEPGDAGASSDKDGAERAPRQGSASGQTTSAPSLPPPSAPMMGLPPATTGKIEFCGSCNRHVEKGEICARCGWNNAEQHRHCRQCKKKLSLVSMVTRSTVATVLFGVAVVAIAAPVLLLFGALAGVAAAVFCAALVIVGDALTLRYACKTCTVTVYSERVQKEETVRIGKARTKGLALAGAAGVAAIAVFAGSGASEHAIVDSSYGIAWTLRVPGTHSRIASEVAQLTVPSGQKRARVQFAERPFLGGSTYYLAHYQHTSPSGSAELDKPALQEGAKQLVKSYFAGQISGSLEPSGDAFQGSFSGTFHNRPIFGRLRATQYEQDIVIVAVTSAAEADLKDPSVDHALASVSVKRDAK